MRTGARAGALLHLLLTVAFTTLTAGTKLSLTVPSTGEMIISADPALHQDFGLAYPVTYKIAIPAGSSALAVYSKHLDGAPWVQLPEKTANDYFNGIEAVRFDYAANAAYVSAAFDSTSDDIFLKVTDGAGQPVAIQFQNICKYYDNRQAAVTLTADDWKEYTSPAFVQSVHIVRSHNLPLTVAIITGGCTTNTWQTIQAELDSGLVEAASHTRSHVDPPYPDPISEVIGSKQDILANLRLPPLFRKGSQGYVYAWIAPFGSTTTETESIVSQAGYLIDRGVFASTGNFTSWSAADHRYLMDGKTAEMGPSWGGLTDANALNSLFDQSLTGRTIYHLMLHPQVLADSNLWQKPDLSQHLSYISNRKNVWYVNFGTLYAYHLLQDDVVGAIEVVGGPPTIITQPAGITAVQGESATFSVTASGSGPMTYQWQKNGTNIPGATSAFYSTPTLTEADSGTVFRCMISNNLGSITSSNALLTVTPLVINALANGSFESGTTSWSFYSNGSGSFTQASSGSSGASSAQLSINAAGTNVQLYQAPLTIEPNTNYRLTFDAYSSSGHDLDVSLNQHVSPYKNYGLNSYRFDLSTSWKSFSIDFTTSGFASTVTDGRLMFWLAPYATAGDQYHVDNVVLARVIDLAPPVVSPQVTVQPLPQTVMAGQTATFSVGATGTTPMSYQWQKNGVDIPGGTGITYMTPATASTDSGALYQCRVTNAGGSATSTTALLTVITPRPAKVSVQPRDTTVQEGHTVNFTVVATGDAPLTFQWQKNSIDIPGAVATSYSLAMAARTDSGSTFRCIVSNNAGKDTSRAALLKVLGIPPTVLMGPLPQTVTAGQTAAFAVSATGTAPLTYQWQKNGADIVGGGDSVYTTPPVSAADSGAVFRCVVKNVAGSANSQSAQLTVITPRPPTVTLEPRDTTVLEGHAAHFAVAAIGTAPLAYQWQKDGADIAGATASLYSLTAAARSDSGSAFRCIITNSVGKDTSNAALLHVVPVPPVITTGPTGKTVNVGQTATFHLAATGSAPMHYQWQKDTVNINGANDSAYTTPATVTADSGTSFRCVVSNAAGSVTSASVHLTVITPYPPVVTLQPRDTTVLDGHAVSFNVSATGTAPLTYQWQKNGADIGGATGSSFSIPAAARSDSGAAFRCIVTNGVGKDTSKSAYMHVLPVPPVITTQPVARTVDMGQTATYFVAAAGSAPLHYQWQKDTVDIGGALDSVYTTPATVTADSGTTFRCVVSNAAGSVTSVGVHLTVITPYPPVVIVDPRDTTVLDGQLAHFAVYATGTPPLAYQWQKNNTNLSGATSSTYSVSSVRSDSGVTFRCIVSNSTGKDTSGPALLSVLPVPPTITAQPVARSVNVGHTATFSITARGSTPVGYQWQKNDIDIPGAKDTSYTTPATTAADSGARFRCIVANVAGGDTSARATLTVISVYPAVVTGQPRDTTVVEGQIAMFGVVAAGTAPISYRWQKNGIDIAGANAASYITAASAYTDSGTAFRCIVSNAVGRDTSRAAILRVLPLSPTISSQPTSQSVMVGYAAEFSVAATGTPPLRYQWQKNGSAIAGATGPTYDTPAAVASDSGAAFRCMVTNPGGSVMSQAALLIVNKPPAIPNAVANGTFESGTASWQFYSNGAASYAAVTPGSSGSGQAVQVSVTSEGTNVQLFQPGITLQPNTSYQLTFDAYCNTGHDVEVNLSQHVAPYTSYGLSGHTFDLTASWQSFSVTFTTSGFSSAVNDARLWFWMAPYDAAGDRYYFDNVQLTKTSDLAPTPPSITQQPVTQTVYVGQAATFTVTATGTAPLSYQWQKNNANIPGATTTSYTTGTAASTDSGTSYRCRVSNIATSIFSNSAQILVLTPQAPVVTVDPHDTTVQEGKAAQFTAAATGSSPLSYQWQKNGTNINGATTPTYSLTAAHTDSGAAFRCVVSNIAGKDTSLAGRLFVLAAPPVITVQPGNQTVTVGQSAAFSVTATGSAPLTYQWQRNGTPISGATDATYATGPTAAADSGAIFRCVVTNIAGSATGQPAVLIVNKTMPNLLTNGTFESGATGWNFYTNGAGSYAAASPGSSGTGNAMQISIATEGTNVQLYQYGLTLQPNTSYQLSFDAYSSTGHDVQVSLVQHVAPYANYGLSDRVFNLTTSWQNFSASFTTSGFSGTVSDARLMFWLAPYDAAGDRFYLDNVVLSSPLAMQGDPGGEPLAPPLASIVPGDFILHGNFPNPFNPSTVIRYGLPEPAMVSVRIYNMLGQEVARLSDGSQPAGTYQVIWEGRRSSGGVVSSGVYLCRMVATTSAGKTFVATTRMVLMK
jgi:hypothetical protein